MAKGRINIGASVTVNAKEDGSLKKIEQRLEDMSNADIKVEIGDIKRALKELEKLDKIAPTATASKREELEGKLKLLKDIAAARKLDFEEQVKAAELKKKQLKFVKAKNDKGEVIPQTYVSEDGKYRAEKGTVGWNLYEKDSRGIETFVTAYEKLKDIKSDTSLVSNQEAVSQEKVKASIDETTTAIERQTDAIENNNKAKKESKKSDTSEVAAQSKSVKTYEQGYADGKQESEKAKKALEEANKALNSEIDTLSDENKRLKESLSNTNRTYDRYSATVYHGSKSQLNNVDFDPSKTKGMSNLGAGALYTTPSMEQAIKHGKNLLELQVDLNRAFILTEEHITSISDLYKAMGKEVPKDANWKTIKSDLHSFNGNKENSKLFAQRMKEMGYQGIYSKGYGYLDDSTEQLAIFDDRYLHNLSTVDAKTKTIANQASVVKEEFKDLTEENQSVDTLRQKVLAVNQAIDSKTEAFKNEGSVVDSVVAGEIAALDKLNSKLNKVKASVDFKSDAFKQEGSNANNNISETANVNKQVVSENNHNKELQEKERIYQRLKERIAETIRLQKIVNAGNMRIVPEYGDNGNLVPGLGYYIGKGETTNNQVTKTKIKDKLKSIKSLSSTNESGENDKIIDYNIDQLAAYVATYKNLDEAKELFGKREMALWNQIIERIELAKKAKDAYEKSDWNYQFMREDARSLGDSDVKYTYGDHDKLASFIKNGDSDGALNFLSEKFKIELDPEINTGAVTEEVRENTGNTPVSVNIKPVVNDKPLNGEQLSMDFDAAEQAANERAAAEAKVNAELDERIAKEKQLINQKAEIIYLSKELNATEKGSRDRWSDEDKIGFEQLKLEISAMKNRKDLDAESIDILRSKVQYYKDLTKEIKAQKAAEEKPKNTFGDKELKNVKKNMAKASSYGVQFKDSEKVQAQLEELSSIYDQLKIKQNEFANSSGEVAEKVEQEFNELLVAFNSRYEELNRIVSDSNKLTKKTRFDPVEIDPSIASDAKMLEEAMKKAVRSGEHGRLQFGKFNEELKTMEYQVKETRGQWSHFVVQLDATGTKIVSANSAIKKTNTLLKEITSSTLSKMKSAIGNITGYDLIYRIINVTKQGIQYVREIDSALTELKKVTDETEESYRNFLQTASKTAAAVGSTVKDITTMTADWSRLGYSMEQAASLAESTAVLLNVSEFSDANQASEALISTIQAYGYAADESMSVVDILNEVGNNFAVSSDGLATALQTSASALMSAGNDLNQSVALVAAANKVVDFVPRYHSNMVA